VFVLVVPHLASWISNGSTEGWWVCSLMQQLVSCPVCLSLLGVLARYGLVVDRPRTSLVQHHPAFQPVCKGLVTSACHNLVH
jgi:hypothetical protein